MNTVEHHSWPWPHWTVDDFLPLEILQELKSINDGHQQIVPGRRRDSCRTFIGDQHQQCWPGLYQLWRDLHGPLHQWFGSYTGVDYSHMHPRLEVISDQGWFELVPHNDHAEKRLTAFVYTDHSRLWPGTMLTNGYCIESKDNRCFFFVPGANTTHSYPRTYFDQVRRCLQINYWTVSA